MGYKVVLTEAARDDLGAIVRFIAHDSTRSASTVGNEILDTALSLTFLPRRGVAVRYRPGLRKLVHSHYLIFYQVNEAQQWVEVVRIWDGRQHPDTLHLP
jgi:plasmid stabilization system protein ParE